MIRDYNLTKWQSVIYRNYGKVPSTNLAKVLCVDVEVIEENAKLLGLGKILYNPEWLEKGFVTIIRCNWDLLTLEDIAVLLGTSVKELKVILAEYDFLDIKLGEKPFTEKSVYTPLSQEEIKITEQVRKVTEKEYIAPTVKPFDFFNNRAESFYIEPENKLVKDIFTSNYCAKYSGSLLDDNLSDYSDEYLEMLSSTGTNGIWLSDTLRNLAEFPFDKSYSTDYQIRIKNLRKLTERCAKHNIGMYLYLNEPRSLPEEFYAKYPHFRGQRADDGTYCLCTSVKEVRDYLYQAVKSVAENLPLLKAVMTITMSENPTHCFSRPWNGGPKLTTTCPRCKDRKPYEMIAEINNVIKKALQDGNGKTILIANIWGWADFTPDMYEGIHKCIDLLDKDIEILSVSEYNKFFNRGGVDCKVRDYSISVVGPGDLAKEVLEYARKKGHKIWAKIQVNNSWECSAVPYIPVFDLMLEHINNLKCLNVDGLMTGWSLGGFPGGALSFCTSACGKEEFNPLIWYQKTYGEKDTIIKRATELFSKAFKNFPFSIDSIYFGGQNLGCANLWSLEQQNKTSTMVCFSFDDNQTWSIPYGVNVYLQLMDKLCVDWEKGLKEIENIFGNRAVEEYKDCALACYCHFKSAYNLTLLSILKKDLKSNNKAIQECIENEYKLTQKLYELICKNATIGFEMTNHYYYNENLLLDKLINLKYCEEELKKYK